MDEAARRFREQAALRNGESASSEDADTGKSCRRRPVSTRGYARGKALGLSKWPMNSVSRFVPEQA